MGIFDNIGGMISGAAGNIGDMAKAQPEMFGGILDQMGSRLYAGNPVAGIGTAVGQSTLANKELQAQRQQQMDWNEFVKGLISGNTAMTPAELEGVTKMSMAPGKDGKRQLTLGVTMPEALTSSPSALAQSSQTPQTPSYKNLGGMINDPF